MAKMLREPAGRARAFRSFRFLFCRKARLPFRSHQAPLHGKPSTLVCSDAGHSEHRWRVQGIRDQGLGLGLLLATTHFLAREDARRFRVLRYAYR